MAKVVIHFHYTMVMGVQYCVVIYRSVRHHKGFNHKQSMAGIGRANIDLLAIAINQGLIPPFYGGICCQTCPGFADCDVWLLCTM